MPLPASGHVLGIDVGYSTKRRSSAACRLSWRDNRFDWHIERFRYEPSERRETITRVAGQNNIMAVALDGPVCGDLVEINKYRIAEKLLTVGLAKLIGKPGQSNAPVGRKLNTATNEAALCVLELNILADANHSKRILDKAILEAFPSSFMGLMLPVAAELNGRRNKKSDRYFEALSADKKFNRLLECLAPNGSFDPDPAAITNHDDRAAFVCALTALCVCAGKYTAVGDENGWIVLPPRACIIRKYWELLEQNAKNEKKRALFCCSS